MIITHPINMQLTDWADCIAFDLDYYGPIARILNEADWKEWASQFSNLSTLISNNFPVPRSFDNWRDWAEAFVKSVEN